MKGTGLMGKAAIKILQDKEVGPVAAVTVVGSLNMDLVIRAPRRPRRGETILGGAFGMTGGGKGSNQALAAARLDAEAFMVGAVGDDDFGRRLRAVLDQSGVNCDRVEVHEDAVTGVAVITVTDDGESSIVLSRGANAALSVEAMERASELFRRSDAALFQMEVPPETVAAGLRLAHDAGCRTFLSAEPPFPLPTEAWEYADCLVLNQKALDVYVTGNASPSDLQSDEEVRGMANRMLDRGVQDVVVTRSARGGQVFSRSAQPFAFDPFKVHVVDNTGARDAFCAALCVALAEGMTMERAARFASAAGALACTRIGAHPSLPWRHEVETLLDETEGDYAG